MPSSHHPIKYANPQLTARKGEFGKLIAFTWAQSYAVDIHDPLFGSWSQRYMRKCGSLMPEKKRAKKADRYGDANASLVEIESMSQRRQYAEMSGCICGYAKAIQTSFSLSSIAVPWAFRAIVGG